MKHCEGLYRHSADKHRIALPIRPQGKKVSQWTIHLDPSDAPVASAMAMSSSSWDRHQCPSSKGCFLPALLIPLPDSFHRVPPLS